MLTSKWKCRVNVMPIPDTSALALHASGILAGWCGRSGLRVLKFLLDFVSLLAGLTRERPCRRELEISIQVVKQCRIILQLGVDVCQYQVKVRVVWAELDGRENASFCLGGAAQPEECPG